MVTAGGGHIVAVNVKGALFAWVEGSCSQLSLGNTDNRPTPACVEGKEYFGGARVRMAACCTYHTLAVTEDVVGLGMIW